MPFSAPSHRRTKSVWHYALWTLFCIYGVVPVLVLLFPGTVSFFVFLNQFSFYFDDLKQPSLTGLTASRHVALSLDTGDTIGVWHILPEFALDDNNLSTSDDKFDVHLASGIPLFIYLHGNGGTRGQQSRVATYTLLRGQQWQVVTFDYRGFGDSSGSASEKNMVEDALYVFRWVRKHAKASPIFLWGHSLGSSVAIQLARQLTVQGDPPAGLILEGAFSNLHDLIDNYILTWPYRLVPFLMNVFHRALRQESISFNSNQHIQHVQCPVLMIHAEDDNVVPVTQAHKLHQAAVEARAGKLSNIVSLHLFPASSGYGHNRINQAPDLGNIVRYFVEQVTRHSQGPKTVVSV